LTSLFRGDEPGERALDGKKKFSEEKLLRELVKRSCSGMGSPYQERNRGLGKKGEKLIGVEGES